MRKYLVVVALLLCGLATAKARCGVERWSIKTLADSEAASVASQAVDSTIEKLRQEPAPRDLKAAPDHRHKPVEVTKYRLHVLLLGYKQESDSDFHLVLASPQDASVTMIAEIPSSSCVPRALRTQSAHLQAWVTKQFGRPRQPGRMLRFRKPRLVIIEGVGFFDFLHGQTGVAPNGIELHPVTSIALGQ